MTEPVPFKYRAFLSYSHRDTRWAKWLHAALESYRIDKDLAGRQTPVGPVPKTLAPIFRDREDFSAGHSLTEQTAAALDASQFVVVLCSPNAAKSQYVNEEIRRFKALGRDDCVIPLIIDGEPGDPERECFPSALRFNVAPDGALSAEPEEPIAADARPQGDGKTVAKIKLIAGLLGVGFDEIVRRAERARKRRLRNIAAIIAGFLFLAVVATGSAVYAYNKLIESEETLDTAVEAAYRLVSDANTKADRFGVPLDIRLTLLNAADGMLDGLIKAGRNTPALRYRRALMLMSFADNYYKLGETTTALARAEEARTQLSELVAERPDHLGWQHDLAMSHVLVGDVLIDRGGLADALTSFRAAVAIDDRLAESVPARLDWQLDLARAFEKLGNVLSDRGSLADALVAYRRARSIVVGLVELEPGNIDAQQFVAVTDQRIGGAQQAQGSLTSALASLRDSLAIRERLVAADPDNTRWQRELITLYRDVGNVLYGQGSLAEALASYGKGVTIATRLTTSDPRNALWQRELAAARLGIGDVRKAERNLDEAIASYRSGLVLIERLAAADTRNMLLQRDLSLWYDRIGQVQEAQGLRAEAYANYVKSFRITQRIAASDVSNTVWQRDLALADLQVGERLAAREQWAEAQNSYQIALTIWSLLLRADPSNRLWQRDMAKIYAHMGELSHKQKEPGEALKHYQLGLEIIERLAAEDPDNLLVQRELWSAYDSSGGVQFELGSIADALTNYRSALTIAERLAAAAPDNVSWQLNLALGYLNLGMRGDETPARLRKAVDILRKLKSAGKLNPQQEGLLTAVEAMLAKLPPP